MGPTVTRGPPSSVVEEVRTAGAAARALCGGTGRRTARRAASSRQLRPLPRRRMARTAGTARRGGSNGGWRGRGETGTGAGTIRAASPQGGGRPCCFDVTCSFVVRDSAGANIAHHVARRYALASTTFANLRLAGLIAIQPFFSGEERTPAELRLVGALIISVPRTDWLWYAFLPPGAAPCRIATALPSSAAPAVSAAAAAPTVLVVLHCGSGRNWRRQRDSPPRRPPRESRGGCSRRPRHLLCRDELEPW
uniref:OSJNBb0067G11.8 protein n=1 Tax=Oryza sativa subsp. japonica TaxID=39947 RepID=Q7XWV9_ORYSJ|nr:OSJNBb0067G11.8 [Oryza sativa Japonica Group]